MGIMKAKFLFLGSGGSLGVPVVGCACAVCKSKSAYNKRTRPSGLITIGEKKFLIDAGPDFRRQALRHNLERLDGLFLTHGHYDHIAGVDELRIFYFIQKAPIPCLISEETREELELRYHYLLKKDTATPFSSTKLTTHILTDDFGETIFEGIPVNYFSYTQANMKVHGFRFGNLAYVTDIQEYSDRVLQALKGVDTLILSALRWTKSPVHFSLGDALSFAEKVGAKKTWLTHIAHDLEHHETNQKLPNHIQLGHDGLELPFDIEVS